MHIRSPAAADIITRAEPHVKMDEPSGLCAADMKENQQRLVMDLLLEYTSRMHEDVAGAHMNQIEGEGKTHIHFAWPGSKSQGEGHCYRLHGPSFLIEYDNTQNSANHIHTVWRDLKGDWGEDLLRNHCAMSH